MTAVLCLGSLLLDTIAVVDRLPGDDERVEAEHVVLAGGGNASTSAVTIARLGVDVDFAGVIGDDDMGRLALSGLAAEGVGVSGVEIRDDIETSHSVVIVNTGRAARTIITRPTTIPTAVPTGYEWMHVDKVGYQALRAAGGSESRVSIDDGNPVADLDLNLIDLYVPTTQVLLDRYGVGDPIEAARRALADGARTVVATDGSRGSFAVTLDTIAYAPALPIVPLSSLGAGDVFHGALLAAVVLGKELPDAIRFANVTAALSCRAIDGRSGIPDRQEVEDVLGELPTTTGQTPALIRELLGRTA
ncbi:carbohydrate kinase family protein [Amnibacterium flavum]|uniref:Ribokinase n=1 Tax=Amnibacterium flavum TaxID=2173173 RepID=A0A2V1HRD7_9MICO|nr:PfkB family carbohydrate kinase [Amnibacterium flavum]PVZ95186.1 ribokinase [Amnibacterium flavum]